MLASWAWEPLDRVGQVKLTFQTHFFAPLPMSKSLHICLYFHRAVSHIQSTFSLNALISEKPYHVFTAILLIACSQISMSRSTAPLAIQKKAPLTLLCWGGRQGWRLKSSIFWPVSLGLTCFLPQKSGHKAFFLLKKGKVIITAGNWPELPGRRDIVS